MFMMKGLGFSGLKVQDRALGSQGLVFSVVRV